MNTKDHICGWVGVERMRAIYDDCTCKVGECWQWVGPTNVDGYGYYSTSGKMCLAHRIAFILFNASIPDGLHVMHLCDNRLCVNPDHLVAGTNAANMFDMKRKRRACQGEDHPKSKLTSEQATEIRVLRKYGYGLDELAILFRVSRPTISKVVSGDAYKKGDDQLC